jgi:hypothetical protein
MTSQKTERTVAVVVGGLAIIGAIGGVAAKFSNLTTRVEQLEQRVSLLSPQKGSRGDLCGQIMTTHMQAIMAGNAGKAKVLSAELDRFSCTRFAAASGPAEEQGGE